jgi:hypothetical protein
MGLRLFMAFGCAECSRTRATGAFLRTLAGRAGWLHSVGVSGWPSDYTVTLIATYTPTGLLLASSRECRFAP